MQNTDTDELARIAKEAYDELKEEGYSVDESNPLLNVVKVPDHAFQRTLHDYRADRRKKNRAASRSRAEQRRKR